MKKVFLKPKILFPIIIVLIILSGIFHPSCGEQKTVVINSGSAPASVARLLKKEEIIGSAKVFRILLKITGSAGKIKAGYYKFPRHINYFSLIRRLQKGSGHYVKVTIPEGFTTEQIAERLYSRGIIESPEKFIKKVLEEDLRGFLFPETYYFSPLAGPQKVVKTMTEQFHKIFNEELIDETERSGFTLKEIITLASLIEKEAKLPEERPVISDIFRKRLEMRMYLESCASILFALGEHRSRLIYKDLEVDSPYNTYRNFGLPPTPICNPGYKSIYAALFPANTGYMYFFVLDDGSHIFSKTYREHLDLQKQLK